MFTDAVVGEGFVSETELSESSTLVVGVMRGLLSADSQIQIEKSNLKLN
jgi:hypothetical protein